MKSVPKKKNDSKCPLKVSKSMVVSGFFRNFAEHLRKMHAQADPPEACEASTNVAKGTDRTSYGGQPKASEVATARPTGCIANSHLTWRTAWLKLWLLHSRPSSLHSRWFHVWVLSLHFNRPLHARRGKGGCGKWKIGHSLAAGPKKKNCV